MDDQHALAVDALMHQTVDDLDHAEVRAEIIAQEFVVIAGEIDNARALAALAQDLLDDVIVRLRPIPRPFQAPAIDDIADQIDCLGVVKTQEVQQ